MTLKRLEISGFKSFGRKASLFFDSPITAIVGPNGSGKSNVAEAFRWVLGEQSLKSLRGKRGEDLIFNGSSSLGKLSRASVQIVFDNTDRRFNIDFDEVMISREVFRDGTNEYSINGSNVRLKDIIELLANVSLGPSGHHIISQGEADRILNSGPADRRAMIEDALGLKIYQWKLNESEKKLTKTEENINQVESIRREIAPHLRFLKKQVEKIEKVNEWKIQLKDLYREYLKREEIYLKNRQTILKKEVTVPQEELSLLENKLSIINETMSRSSDIEQEKELRQVESQIRTIRTNKDELSRQLGRLEGIIEVTQRRLERQVEDDHRPVPLGQIESLNKEIKNKISEVETDNEIFKIKEVLSQIKQLLENFIARYHADDDQNIDNSSVNELDRLKKEKLEVENKIKSLNEEESRLIEKQFVLKQQVEELLVESRATEREGYELRARRSELLSILQSAKSKIETLQIEEENFKREVTEAGVLLGREILNYSDYQIADEVVFNEERSAQETRRREVEKIKIRIEDLGGQGTEVLKEYEEVTNRDEHLAHELEDLAESRETLKSVMLELRQKIDSQFSEGIGKINKEFQRFFEILFGGGTASLEIIRSVNKKEKMDMGISLTEEMPEDNSNIENKEGIEISVSLPRKKIKGLAMLSGGERALTSIALLFAMSQVNPPPFLILDETDAALDEANSRKYSEMISNLSNYSQLILITHNRETMSCAGVLYGVTMGADSVSRLISLKFDEAEAYAK